MFFIITAIVSIRFRTAHVPKGCFFFSFSLFNLSFRFEFCGSGDWSIGFPTDTTITKFQSGCCVIMVYYVIPISELHIQTLDYIAFPQFSSY